MREALVNVFIHNVNVVEKKVAFRKDRKLTVRAHADDRKIFLVLHNAVEVNRLDFEFASLFVEKNAAHLRERAGRARVEIHHCVFSLERMLSAPGTTFGSLERLPLMKAPRARKI